MWLLLAFVAIPLIEIVLFIKVGGLIGLWPTLAFVILTAVLGTWLLRLQGAAALGQLRQSFNELQDPTEPLANGAMLLLAGLLLLTPGFFTDACGFLLLVPRIRASLFRYLRSRIRVQSFSMGQPPRSQPTDPTVIDAEYYEVDPPKRPTHRPDGMTKH